MKAFTHARLALLRVVLGAFVLLAGFGAYVSASSLPTVGHTGQALALRAALHPDAARYVAGNLLRSSWPGLAAGRFKYNAGAFRPFRAVPRPFAGSNPNPILINEAVRTFDLFAPPPAFTTTAGALTPTNLTPVWTSDENYIIFSSNRAGDGHFHLFAVSARGGTPAQITTGPGNEFFPALSKDNSVLAFTSDANSSGDQELYVIGGQSGVGFQIGGSTVDVSQIGSNTGSAKTLGDGGTFTNVGRPALSPAGDRIAFSAVTSATSTGHTTNVRHIYFLYVATNGYLSSPAQGQANPPAQLTDGPAADTDPAWSPKGDFIAFASTATGFTNTGQPISPTTAPTLSAGAGTSRGLFLLNAGTNTAVGTVPTTLSGSNGRVTVAGADDFAPAWSADISNQYTNPNGALEYLAFSRGSSPTQKHDIRYFRLTTNNTDTSITLSPETTGGSNDSNQLNTDDPNNSYDDIYPTWAPFRSIFSISYQSGSVQSGGVLGGRSVTYNTPTTNIPVETAISLADNTNGVGATYTGILESQVLNLDPPTLLRFNGSQVVQVTDAGNNVTKSIQPGQVVNFTVRLSNREAGTDSNNVYVQIKDPDSKYQDSKGLEHKVFANSNDVAIAPDDATSFSPSGSKLTFGSSAELFNGGACATAIGGFNVAYSFNDGAFAGFNTINNAKILQFGSVGGVDGSDTIAVGHGTSGADFRPSGPEYECQYVNPQFGSHSGPDTATTDYGPPYYLAGYDDQRAFSGSTHPARPTANTTGSGGSFTAPAEYLKLTPLPASQQDGQGGVLYGVPWTTPTSPSDYFVDVVAYDNAVFPLRTVPIQTSGTFSYVGLSKNWRLYDNVGGFTTATFDGSNDILVVSDYALGQKFSSTTFGGQNGNANLLATYYGAESYYTDVDENLLPTETDFWTTSPTPIVPAIPAQSSNAAPDQLSATAVAGPPIAITLVWRGNGADSYNVYRSTDGVTFTQIANVAGQTDITKQARTTYNDANVTSGTTYYYEVTAVTGANESAPSNVAMVKAGGTTSGLTHQFQQLSIPGFDGLDGGNPFFPNVENGLGVGSYYDAQIDDGGRVNAITANLPAAANGETNVPNLRSQRYSLWRILSRGPIPTSVLAGYQPTFVSQPAVNDAVNKVTAPAGTNIPVATRCVIWVSPFTGDLPLVDAGSLENPTTQNSLQAFVNVGGRLCIAGQNVAGALSLKGSTNNPFLTSTLGVAFATPAGGSQVLAGNGSRISGDPGFNGGGGVYPVLTSVPTFVNMLPSTEPLLLGGDSDSAPNWRTDASLDQLGPNPTPVFDNSGSGINVVAQINTVTPQTGSTLDTTTGGSAGLTYKTDFSSGFGKGYGSRVVFGSFGLEGISVDYYKVTVNQAKFYVPHNQRSHILHNIVCFLRTGTFSGRITQASGQGVPGATVYLRPNGGTLPGPRQLFSATTAFDGSYTINGVEPGTYFVVAYKSGFTTTVSNVATSVEGDSFANIGLVIAPTPPGRINGKVTDNGGSPIANATLTFTSTDGQTIVTGASGPDGTYNIDNVPAGSYNGVASKKPQYQDAKTTSPVVVPSGGTVTQNFTLTANPATVSGEVFDDTDNGDGTLDNGEPGVGGATVTFTPTNTSITTPTPVTSNSDGTYSVGNLVPGTYNVTASKNGFQTNTPRPVSVQAGDTITRFNIPLMAAPIVQNGTLGGLVADSFNGQALGGASVAITDSSGKAVNGSPFTTSGQTTSPAAPSGDGQPLNYGPVSLPPGKYNVTVTLSGFTSQTQSNQVVVSSQFTRVDFTSQSGSPLQPIHIFPGHQFSFFSVPYDYSSGGIGVVNQIFGPLNTGTFNPLNLNPGNANRSHLFVWSPVLLQYVVDPTPPADGLHLGQGYWVYLNNASEVTVGPPTYPAASTATIPVGLHLGWNMIGVPSTSAITVSRLSFANAAGGGSIAFTDAASSAYHLISGTLYTYNGTGYTTVTANSTMQPWQAYWIYAFADTTVRIPTGGG